MKLDISFRKRAWFAAIGFFLAQLACYQLGNLFSILLGTAENAFAPKIPFIDDAIPIIPVFIVFYIYSYVFWFFSPMAVSLTKKENFINYTIGLLVSYFIGFLTFAFFPSYIDRAGEGLLDYVAEPGIFRKLMGIIYFFDGGTKGFNLTPSFHCLTSVYCYLGVRKQPEISRGYKIYALVLAVLICMSTVFTKQHYIIDVFCGIALPLIVYVIVNLVNPGKRISRKQASE